MSLGGEMTSSKYHSYPSPVSHCVSLYRRGKEYKRDRSFGSTIRQTHCSPTIPLYPSPVGLIDILVLFHGDQRLPTRTARQRMRTRRVCFRTTRRTPQGGNQPGEARIWPC
jgi:hypothetical protein